MILSIAIIGCGHFVSAPTVEPDPACQISKEEKERRTAIEFTRDSAYIINYLSDFYKNLTVERISAWEKSKALEGLTINGQKMYFRNAGRNLFRIDKEAKALYDSLMHPAKDTEDAFLDTYLPQVVSKGRNSGSSLIMSVRYKIGYKLTVKPDQVPAGEIVRAWMPYPRQDQDSQTDIELLSASEANYVISSDDVAHKSIYMEKTAVAGQPTVFTYEVAFTVANEWYDFKPSDVKPYDTASELYKTYTSERAPHCVFSPKIRRIADSLTNGISNPFLKVKAIYSYIVDTYPWASARDYSTLDNIPEYVIDNVHGDCGQVGLLLVNLCRAAGIPARWQSGWMLHPDAVNMHDWSEIYYEGIGWVPTDVSFGRGRDKETNDEDVYNYYLHGLDAFRWIVNSDYSRLFSPAKNFTRSDIVDFQRGEVEWQGGNLYFDQWSGWISSIEYVE